jgi:hypothetical protein
MDSSVSKLLFVRQGARQVGGKEKAHKPFVFLEFFDTGSHSAAQAGLEFIILVPQPPECWDYGSVPPYQLINLLKHL